MITVTMPRSFFCREHRAIPARGMGPAFCWRCEIRQTLWDSLPEDTTMGEEAAEEAPAPSGPKRKFRGALSNLPLGFRPYVVDHALRFDQFRADPACNRNSSGAPLDSSALRSAWGTVTYWRENVQPF